MTIRYRLFAVRLLDDGIDVKGTQNVHGSFIINNDDSVASGRDKGVVDIWHRILMTI